MTIPNRHPGAPYLPGEILDGTADLEVDISEIYRAFNPSAGALAGLKNINFSPDAAISGAKILDASIGTDKIKDNTISGSRFAADAFTAASLADGAITGVSLALGSIFNAAQGYTDSDLTLDVTWDDIVAVTLLTSPEASSVLLLATMNATSNDVSDLVEFQFLRDASVLRTFDLMRHPGTDSSGNFVLWSLMWVDTAHSASTSYSYKLQGQLNAGTGTTITQASIQAIEFRR